eukprot:364162-Pyramimonas_sp.AAC.3
MRRGTIGPALPTSPVRLPPYCARGSGGAAGAPAIGAVDERGDADRGAQEDGRLRGEDRLPGQMARLRAPGGGNIQSK